jgi:histone deacetylase 1/2
MLPDYWAEALNTATHLLNLCPTKPLNLRTPHESLYLAAPNYDHIRVYGCLCYPNTSATTPHKLAPRSLTCVFIGYAPKHKRYRCLDRLTGRVYTSRHVMFDETHFPFSEDLSPDHSDYSYDHGSDIDSPLPDPILSLHPVLPIVLPMPDA